MLEGGLSRNGVYPIRLLQGNLAWIFVAFKTRERIWKVAIFLRSKSISNEKLYYSLISFGTAFILQDFLLYTLHIISRIFILLKGILKHYFIYSGVWLKAVLIDIKI